MNTDLMFMLGGCLKDGSVQVDLDRKDTILTKTGAKNLIYRKGVFSFSTKYSDKSDVIFFFWKNPKTNECHFKAVEFVIENENRLLHVTNNNIDVMSLVVNNLLLIMDIIVRKGSIL